MNYNEVVAELRTRSARDTPCEVNLPEGWVDIVAEFLEVTEALELRFFVVQVKEKMGTLRIYVRNENETPARLEILRTIINRAERRSASTCETCGRPGRLRNGMHQQTLCAEHHNGDADIADTIDGKALEHGVAPARETITRLTEQVASYKARLVALDEEHRNKPDDIWWTANRTVLNTQIEYVDTILEALTKPSE